MKQNTVKVKERYNWPVTILLIIGIVLVILLPFLYGTDDRHQGSHRYEQYSGTAKENQTSELCRCLGND